MYRLCRGFSGFMPGGMFVMMLCVVAIGLVLFWLYTNNKSKSDSSEALRILEERFSKGEIDEAEFESKRRVLERKK